MSAGGKIVICSFARTPIGKFRGGLGSLTAPQLGARAIQGALDKLSSSSSSSEDIIPDEVIMGNVVSSGIGQAPARQASMAANLPESTICTTINKVCASGMKSTMLGVQTLLTDRNKTAIVTGGMESMSNIPHYLMTSRSGTSLGNTTLVDGLIHDGLWDIYNDQHMGMCAEKCATDHSFSRQDQDEYCLQSYQRAQDAIKNGSFDDEIIPVDVPPKRRGADPITVSSDEEPMALKLEKVSTLKPAFDRTSSGTVTAANASSLNDGAAAMILMREEDVKERNDIVQPIGRILGFGDAERSPVDFTIAPSLAVPIALQNAGLTMSDINYHEINEAFSVVVLANMKLLGLLDNASETVNVFGGAVALGHPIGMSGARIIGTLLSVLKAKDATMGCASICNGGGGASAIVVERM